MISFYGPGRAYLPQALDAHSRPWFGKHPVLERGAIKLLKVKEGYLRMVGQALPPVSEKDLSRIPS